MRRATPEDVVKVGDHVMWGLPDATLSVYEVKGIRKGSKRPTMLNLRREPVDSEPLDNWVLQDEVFVDIDSDEDRQYIFDRLEEQRRYEQSLYAQVDGGDSAVMGETFKIRGRDVSQTVDVDASSAEAVLREAVAVLAERGRRYDNASGSPAITRTAELWSAFLGRAVDETDVCEMMVLHKMARRLQDRAGRDHHLDMVNYSALAGSFARRAQEDELWSTD